VSGASALLLADGGHGDSNFDAIVRGASVKTFGYPVTLIASVLYCSTIRDSRLCPNRSAPRGHWGTGEGGGTRQNAALPRRSPTVPHLSSAQTMGFVAPAMVTGRRPSENQPSQAARGSSSSFLPFLTLPLPLLFFLSVLLSFRLPVRLVRHHP